MQQHTTEKAAAALAPLCDKLSTEIESKGLETQIIEQSQFVVECDNKFGLLH